MELRRDRIRVSYRGTGSREIPRYADCATGQDSKANVFPLTNLLKASKLPCLGCVYQNTTDCGEYTPFPDTATQQCRGSAYDSMQSVQLA